MYCVEISEVKLKNLPFQTYGQVLRGMSSVATVMPNQELHSLHFTPLGNIINLNRIWMPMNPQLPKKTFSLICDAFKY